MALEARCTRVAENGNHLSCARDQETTFPLHFAFYTSLPILDDLNKRTASSHPDLTQLGGSIQQLIAPHFDVVEHR